MSKCQIICALCDNTEFFRTCSFLQSFRITDLESFTEQIDVRVNDGWIGAQATYGRV